MIVTIVHIRVKEAHLEAFIDATLLNHKQSRKEAGNLRFDFLQDAEDPTKFVLYEVYRSEEDVASHKRTSHYLTWRETVQDWMAEPRRGIRHEVVAPLSMESW